MAGSGTQQDRARARSWDLHSKRTVTAGLADLLAAAGVPAPAGWTPHAVELPAGAHRPDLVFLSDDGTVLHIEVQQEADRDMAGRLAEYAVRIARTEPFRTAATDLVQVVVQVTGTPMPTSFQLGELRNAARLVHVPSVPPEAWPAGSPLTPFALARRGVEGVGPVVSAIAAARDPDLRTSMTVLAVSLAPQLADTIVTEIGRVGMVDVIEAVAQTEFGRGLIAQGRGEGRGEGRREMLTEVLLARFPGADHGRVERTAARLQAQLGSGAARVALDLDRLDV